MSGIWVSFGIVFGVIGKSRGSPSRVGVYMVRPVAIATFVHITSSSQPYLPREECCCDVIMPLTGRVLVAFNINILISPT
jgi:hypothetical protein